MKIFKRISREARHSPFSEICQQVLTSTDPFARSTCQGHITASGLVIQDGKVLLIFHPYIKQWFQPGGHIDYGESPICAAIREVLEETGVVCKPLDSDSEPIDIDLHEIPANPKKREGTHLHIDLLYPLAFVEERASLEEMQCVWLPMNEVSNPRIQRVLATLQAKD